MSNDQDRTDLARIADALERIADSLATITRLLDRQARPLDPRGGRRAGAG